MTICPLLCLFACLPRNATNTHLASVRIAHGPALRDYLPAVCETFCLATPRQCPVYTHLAPGRTLPNSRFDYFVFLRVSHCQSPPRKSYTDNNRDSHCVSAH